MNWNSSWTFGISFLKEQSVNVEGWWGFVVVKCAMSLSITSSVILILIDLNCCVLHRLFFAGKLSEYASITGCVYLTVIRSSRSLSKKCFCLPQEWLNTGGHSAMQCRIMVTLFAHLTSVSWDKQHPHMGLLNFSSAWLTDPTVWSRIQLRKIWSSHPNASWHQGTLLS